MTVRSARNTADQAAEAELWPWLAQASILIVDDEVDSTGRCNTGLISGF